MTLAINFQLPTPKIHRQTTVNVAGNLIYPPTPANIRRPPPRRFTVTSVQSSENVASISTDPSVSSQFTTSVASPSIQLTLTQRHFTVLNVAACAVAISATWLFCSAIPMLLAFKRAAESLEKLLDVTREELPDTMAAVRLSGMEISDLTTELSDLGQGLTQGVKRSTNAVRVAEAKLRDFANLTSKASIQEVLKTQASRAEPAVARTARGIREGIVKIRAVLNMVFALSSFSTLVVNYISN
ncbi:uncharacterized protein LOC141586868 isoform X1 [Silene latifolia]|uniref:uncharacterized protein LOC141586868 isoform X1 n=1 Tax=Silene latifolia TaxID=37657 RepID=UPI003D78302F